MRLPFHQRPLRQLLWIIIASNALTTLGFGAASALSWRLAEDQRLPLSLKLPCLSAMLIGLIGNILAELALSRGIKRHHWPQETLTSVLAHLDRPVYTALGSVCVIGCLVAIIVLPLGRGTGLIIAFLIPSQTLNYIRSALRKDTKTAQSTTGSALTHAKPLHSDHWGAPSHPATK